MGLLVVGSIALDSVETPFDKTDNALGGSSTYISLSASYFSGPVYLVGVVGDDFQEEHIELLEDHNINLEGLQKIEGGRTFRWGGKYHYDLNVRDTLFTDLGVFEKFDPVIPEKLRKCSFVVLGNIQPDLQTKVLDQIVKPKFVVCDTMNLWIENQKEDLLKVLKRVNVLIINDSEARLLSQEPNLIKAAHKIREMGPQYLIIKKGEHGALLFGEEGTFSAPAYPMENIYDPTGAGDSFAGGFTGYLLKTGDVTFENLKRAVVYGSALASFCVEKFSTKGLEDLSYFAIHDRFMEFHNLSMFDTDE
ncbi:MAG: bifunctional hydroxymethylpyrimidine kinase/phosphomethylpyrimidine kinase [Melioribacteraceae bacterium]|nr:bifunctional hydroxymethylpyrimidine kinase/phosphomethylpyrimidine kinase [Melioribacteraceae bacterium]MCF8355197.1 bifunctional hydroxymethylpyrimidine kinase/phosphomethylpyrimidine kinase [Melioribacteraceae bacterium]MCF8396183.1 bifunctional hydroxymethylpyrimidine kinase/phosphomethylpyrimidine kinase [Melioribacteraceae bacterium]MCF8419884.1 bifunctional hydroxymethylpyrimidine kinase/phosphomethylpyrimidine kinase [Melioribacteraceae bacterium]